MHELLVLATGTAFGASLGIVAYCFFALVRPGPCDRLERAITAAWRRRHAVAPPQWFG